MPARLSHRKILGERLRHYRKKAGITQEHLAEKADLSTVFISRLERGVDTVSVDSLLRIARALGVRLHQLVKEL